MTFEDLEREWLRRQRGRRKEWTVAIVAGAVLLLLLGVVGYFLWPRLSGLFI